ncbi:hypothetical protein PF010_g22846 [Phytophthora fragariae]|uniref:Uncharacterized protein n=2 Tax=Phytophthora TaxID=4783 RepID=A0A6A3EJ73_9STRA|nr:hypothetical protein PF003_g18485 [Phytophthora fragariae]KAE9013093.1 hypothetical protein PR002_g14625 [Phytophthora rubi]KAE8932543.1 hypothetical protein PF009_g17437 [Phytophthora fragariae]KAE9079170.1 hypothetical protein PF010_g22846 [Phytophthora fragariae]KAE9098149.1 hypothetical protein PF007_g16374 [Phytophthora fragariae]
MHLTRSPEQFLASSQSDELDTRALTLSVATLTSLMETVTKAVEKAIGDEMSEHYGLILDG